MITCLENIVSVKDLCQNGTPVVSTSGYDIWQAPEVKYKGIAAITDEKYVRGFNLLIAKREMAIREVESDFLKVTTTNGYVLSQPVGNHETGIFDTNVSNPSSAMERGITIHAARPSLIKKIRIKEVKVSPVNSIDTAQLKIYDNGQVAIYDVQLKGGMINSFPVNYTASGDYVRILIDTSNLLTYSSRLTCMIGCNGTIPNDCGFVTGWAGNREVKSEGFGINATFDCVCDFSHLLCSWGKQFVGEIVWYKMRALVQEELLTSDRLNNFTIYNREEAKEKFVELENAYREKWNTFAQALPSLLKNVRDNCISCNKPKWVTNL